MSDEIRRKANNAKPETPRSRVEASDVDIMASKRHAERLSTSREKTEYESSPMKRSKTADVKDVHEIIDEREGGRMQLKTLEQRAAQQAFQHRVDAFKYVQCIIYINSSGRF